MGIIRNPTIFANIRRKGIERKKRQKAYFLFSTIRLFGHLTCNKHMHGLHGTETLTQKLSIK
jgi:hypothetical protein